MPTIVPDPDKVQDTARRLLAAADDPNEVETDTQGTGVAFVVSDELAAAAGFGEPDEDAEESPPEEGGDEDTDSADSAPADVEEPPRGGAGSGAAEWRAFLTAQGVTIPDDADTRDDLIALWDNRQK